MIFLWVLRKLKSFFLLFVNFFRRALCCFRKRRPSFSETVQLTHVISNVDDETHNWSEWGDDGSFRDNKPRTVQDYIEQYREQTMKARTTEDTQERTEEEALLLLGDMAPRITRQTKILVRTKHDNDKSNFNNRLNAVEDSVNVIPSRELREWEENNGWEGELLLDQEAQQVLREQKRLEREKRAGEQHQRRLEKTSRTLGSKLAT